MLNVEQFLEVNIFHVLKSTFDAMGTIENVERVINCSLVDNLELKIKELGSSVVTFFTRQKCLSAVWLFN